MKKAHTLFLVFVLALPIFGSLGLVAEKQIEINQSIVKRIPITGYDPISLMYGHYLQFTYSGPTAPDKESHKYFIPEDQAEKLEKILNNRGSRSVEIDVHMKADKVVGYGMLYLDGQPWRYYLANPH